ncbi:MAG TPA: exosortase-associated EpsI family protein, partial [Armatimonadota bacterium]|nr:exosortase-associated EpsI family protein [Armatimonadota bacterium]
MKRYRLLVLNTLLLLTAAGAYAGRRSEDVPRSSRNYLAELPLSFQGWKISDTPLSKSELELLEPDAVVARSYAGPHGEGVGLVVVAGRRKKTVHTPGFCMPSAGWEVMTQNSHPLPIAGHAIVSTRALMVKDGRQILTT